MSHKEHFMFATCYFITLIIALIVSLKATSMRRVLGNIVDQKGMLVDIFTSTVMVLSGILFLEYMIL
jgi:hypothetical protein